MELGIQGRVDNQLPVQKQAAAQIVQSGQSETAKAAAKEAALNIKNLHKKNPSPPVSHSVSKEEIDKYIKKVIRDASLLNRDLKYSVNSETNEVIVRVVDKTTNKVIKEIPPESLQKLAMQLKKQIGIILDENI